MRQFAGGLVCVLLLGGAAASGAQESLSCRWAPKGGAPLRNVFLHGVDAPEPTNVFTVGTGYSGGQWRTLVRHWDGSSWETQPSPNANKQTHTLNDVAVAADGTAWAVGERGESKVKTIVQRYNGTSWRMRPSLNPSADRNVLYGVDVAPSGDVYAAGARLNAKRRYRTMVHHYDGAAWKMVASRYPGVLWDLDAIADDDIWAVGWKAARGDRRPLVLHFDGTSWSEAAAPPSPGEGFGVLYAVSAAAPDDVWAVGDWFDGDKPRAWIIHFDGESWSAPEIPDLGTFVGLRGVSALDADTAVAVGEDADAGDNRIVLEWDGTEWTRAEQDGDGQSSWLDAVDLAPSGEGWAVGYHSGDPAPEEYVERRTCG